MELGRYFEVVKRWWWLIVVSVALAAGASYVYSERQPRIYASRTTLMVGTGIQNPNPNERELGLSRTLAEIYAQLVLRRPITMAVIDKLGLDMSPDQLSGMISTNVIPDVQLLEITVFDIHPQRAQILADAVAKELILQSPTEAREQQTTRQFIYSQLQELQAKIEEASLQINEIEDSMLAMTSAADIAEAKSRLSELQALKSNYQANYTGLLDHLSDSSINTLTIVEPATISNWPVAPDVKKNVLIAAIGGLALSVSAVLLLEFASDTLTWTAGSAQTVAGIRVLGTLGKLSPSSDKLIARTGVWSPEADAIRNLRTNIFLSMRDRDIRTLLVASPEMGEGKTLTAANLAAITASGGSATVLVDADLRKPSVHEWFDLPNLFGLADVLAASEETFDETLDRALQAVDIANLWVLPAGKVPIDPTLLLGSPTLARLIERLRERAQLVIFDCGPVLLHPDPAILATRVDASLLVVRHDQSSRRAAQKTIDRFAALELTNLVGIVFNGVSLPRRYYLYSRYRSKPKKATAAKAGGRGWWGRLRLPFGRGAQPDDTMLSPADVAEYLGVTEATASRWCEAGRIPAVKIGRRWWVRTEDLRQFAMNYGGGYGLGEMELSEV